MVSMCVGGGGVNKPQALKEEALLLSHDLSSVCVHEIITPTLLCKLFKKILIGTRLTTLALKHY